MQYKRCFKCKKKKHVEQFYAHKAMKDGRLGKCKSCTKRDVAEHRLKNIESIRVYEKKRFKQSARKAKVLEYQRTRRRSPEGKAKNIARSRIAYALRTNKIERKPCEVCGETKSEAHHDDYSKPIEVRWLCFRHHREAHGQIVA